MVKYVTMALFMSLTINLMAQVTIGSDNPPKEYSILQIDGTGGGLRLPKVNTKERDKLSLSLDQETAPGLVIFNTDEKQIQFWNGEKWISMLTAKALVESTNGIEGSNSFRLGGNLTENTTISQPENNLLFFDVTTGRISIGDNILVVNQTGVGIGKNPSKSAFDIFSPSAGGIRINTGKKQVVGDVLTSDSEGNASWQPMAAVPTSKHGVWNTANIANINQNTPLALADIELEPGKWIITARYVAESSGKARLPYRRSNVAIDRPVVGTAGSEYKYKLEGGTYGNLAWIMFGKKGITDLNPESKEYIASIGILPACDEANVATSGAAENESKVTATPYLTYIMDITEKATYTLYGNLSVIGAGDIRIKDLEGSTIGIPPYGTSYLTAIKLTSE